MTDYASLSDLHTYLGVDITDTTNDVAMSMAITAASSAIDRTCNRTFQAQDSQATTRYFTQTKEYQERWFMLPSGLWQTWYPFYDQWPYFFVAPDHKVR